MLHVRCSEEPWDHAYGVVLGPPQQASFSEGNHLKWFAKDHLLSISSGLHAIQPSGQYSRADFGRLSVTSNTGWVHCSGRTTYQRLLVWAALVAHKSAFSLHVNVRQSPGGSGKASECFLVIILWCQGLFQCRSSLTPVSAMVSCSPEAQALLEEEQTFLAEWDPLAPAPRAPGCPLCWWQYVPAGVKSTWEEHTL